jgi:hypothetical protein
MAEPQPWTDNGDGTWQAAGPDGMACKVRPDPNGSGAYEGRLEDAFGRTYFNLLYPDAASAMAGVDSVVAGMP